MSLGVNADAGSTVRNAVIAAGPTQCRYDPAMLTGRLAQQIAFLVEADKFAWLMPFAVLLLPAGLALFMVAGLPGVLDAQHGIAAEGHHRPGRDPHAPGAVVATSNKSDLACLTAELRGRDTGEPVWRLPLPVEYRKQVESSVADMKNIGGNFGSLHNQVFLPSVSCE